MNPQKKERIHSFLRAFLPALTNAHQYTISHQLAVASIETAYTELLEAIGRDLTLPIVIVEDRVVVNEEPLEDSIYISRFIQFFRSRGIQHIPARYIGTARTGLLHPLHRSDVRRSTGDEHPVRIGRAVQRCDAGAAAQPLQARGRWADAASVAHPHPRRRLLRRGPQRPQCDVPGPGEQGLGGGHDQLPAGFLRDVVAQFAVGVRSCGGDPCSLPGAAGCTGRDPLFESPQRGGQHQHGERDAHGLQRRGDQALHAAYVDDPAEKPAACYSIGNVVHFLSQYSRPDLGPIEGALNLNGMSDEVLAVASNYGGLLDTALVSGPFRPALYMYHQSGDPVVGCNYQRGLWGMPLGVGDNYPWPYGSSASPTCAFSTSVPHRGDTSITRTSAMNMRCMIRRGSCWRPPNSCASSSAALPPGRSLPPAFSWRVRTTPLPA